VSTLSEILQRLFDHVAALWPLVVIDPWETALLVRLGKPRGELVPGVHWLWPFIEVAFTTETNAEVFTAGKQTIDGVTFEVVGVFRLVDVTRFYVELNDAPGEAVSMAVAAAASKAMSSGAWKGATDQMLKAVLHAARLRTRRWGIRVEWIEFRTVTDSPTLRLLTDNTPTAVREVV